MRALLDVSVLLASLDANHADHGRCRAWLEANSDAGWASCAMTQNGYVRVVSQPAYPNQLPVGEAIGKLRRATETPYHELWPADVTITDHRVDGDRVHGSRQVTDAYLLLLAVHREGRFVTLDQRVALSTVRGASADHLVVI